MRGMAKTLWAVGWWSTLGLWLGAEPVLAVNDLILTVAPGSTIVSPGDVVTVTLDAANLTAPINGVQALIGYNASLFSLIDIVPTDLGLTPPAQGWFEVQFSDASGAITYTVVINGGSTSANHTVATLTFDVLAEGTTSVFFRPNSGPFATKLTVAADNATIFPTKTNSGSIVSQCTDGVFCNGLETFDGFVCQPGTNPCTDGVACTVDTCTEATDTCSNTVNHAFCSDGLFCNGSETCHIVNGCQPGVFPCGDGVACTDDFCNETNDTCSSVENDANCDDGLFCNGAETCNALLGCRLGMFPCSDGVSCTIDTCNEGLDQCVHTPNDVSCDNGIFCDGAEFCDPVLGCQPDVDPCFPLLCDEGTDSCLAPVHVIALESFYNGRFSNAAHPGKSFVASGSAATMANVTNYTRGITGIRVRFDNIVTFATTPAAAFSFDWTTGSGTTFSPVTDAATMITVTSNVVGSETVVTIAIADNHIRRRWLRVTVNANQVTVSGTPLDGEMVGNPATLPSGNGTPGGNAVFYVGNLTGDVDADRKTSLTDVGLIRAQVNPFLNVPITNVNDVDKDGKVQLADVGAARADVNPFFTLPLLVP